MKHCIRYSGHLILLALLNFIAYSTSIKDNVQLQSKGKDIYHNFEIGHGSNQLASRSESARYRMQATMFDLMNNGLERRKRQTELMDLDDTKDTESAETPEEEGFLDQDSSCGFKHTQEIYDLVESMKQNHTVVINF